MASFYISPCTNRVYLRVYNPEKQKFVEIYTGYFADTITQEEADFLKDTVIEHLERSVRYVIVS